MRGPKPKPVEIKRQEGNRGKRAMPEPLNVGKRLVADAPIEIDEIDLSGRTDVPDKYANAEWMPTPPETLRLTDHLLEEAGDDPSACRLWHSVCALLIRDNIITEGDLFAVEAFVTAKLEVDRAYFELRTEGSTVATMNPRGGRPGKTTNPAYRVWRDANTEMRKWAEHLGLTPVARARLGLTIGKGRKLAKELETDLPANPVDRSADYESTAIEE